MSTHVPRIEVPRRLDWSRYCRNGQVANGILARRLVDQHNHILAYRRKVWMVKPMIASQIPAGQSAGTTDWFYVAGHTGHGVRELQCHVVMAKADNAGASDPYVDFQVTPGLSGGTTITSNAAHYGSIDTSPNDYADEFHHAILRITTDDGLSADQFYRVAVRCSDYARIAAATIVEVGDFPVDTADGAVDPDVGVRAPILDDQVANVCEALTDVWQHNPGTVLQWSRDVQSSAPAKTGATYSNPFDSSTSVAASSVGWELDLQYRNTVAQSAVPVRMIVRAQNTSGSSPFTDNKVRITDGTNSLEIDTIDGSTLWYSVTGTLPASDDQKWDIQLRSAGGSNTIRLDCVYVFEYQA